MQNETQTILVTKPDTNGFAVTALILGITGVVFNLIPFLPYLLGVLAITFGVLGIKKSVGVGLAKSGLVLGIITIGLKLLFWLFLFGLGSIS